MRTTFQTTDDQQSEQSIFFRNLRGCEDKNFLKFRNRTRVKHVLKLATSKSTRVKHVLKLFDVTW